MFSSSSPFERTSIFVEQEEKAIKRARGSATCDRLGAAPSFFPPGHLERITSSSKSCTGLRPYPSAFWRFQYSPVPILQSHSITLQRSLSAAVEYLVIPRSENRKRGRIFDREGEGRKKTNQKSVTEPLQRRLGFDPTL